MKVWIIEEYNDMDGYYSSWEMEAICDSEKTADKWLEDYANKEMTRVIKSEEWYRKHIPICLNPEYHIQDFRVREIEVVIK